MVLLSINNTSGHPTSLVGHKSENMETALIQRFTNLDINFKNCKG